MKLIEAPMDEESDLLPNMYARSVDGGVDRISQLPDDIIIHILSFLTLKKAAATSVLSSRWLDVWKYTPNLDFDSDVLLPDHDTPPVSSAVYVPARASLRHDKWFIDIVNLVIQSHKAVSLEKFRIELFVKKSDKCSVTKWLEFVFSRQVESLDLSLLRRFENDEFVLEELLRESGICLQPQTDLIFFQSLKRLQLTCLKVSGEDIELFLRNCPLLEQLKMQSVTLTSDVAVCGEKLLLKHLDIFCCKGEKSIKVSAPNLTFIRFFNIEVVKLFLENVPKLQILNLTLFYSKTFFRLQEILANGFTQMPNLKKLALSCYDTYSHRLPRVIALINDLVELVMYISNNCIALRKIIIKAPAKRGYLTQQLQGKVPNHIQLELLG